MAEVDNQYLNETISNLLALVGAKKDISRDLLQKPFHEGKIKECIEVIAGYLGLPIKINLFYVSPNYVSSNTVGGQSFTSQHLVKTDAKGRGVAGITAQVLIPGYLPLYGSRDLANFPIDVKISENCKDYFNTFVAIIAHELSHIVLHSLRYKEKDNEIYTDIAAMLLGFNDITRVGREVVKEHKETNIFTTTTITETTKYGYLSDEQFWFVYDKINRFLRENKNIKRKIFIQILSQRKQLAALKNDIYKFRSYIKFLDKNLKRKINPSDVKEIVSFHQSSYLDDTEKTIKIIEEKLQENYNFIKSRKHYYKDLFKKVEEDVVTIKSDVSAKKELVKEDLKILRRNICLFDKTKLYLSTFFKRHGTKNEQKRK